MPTTIRLSIIILFISTLNSYGQTFSPTRLDSLFKAIEANGPGMGSVAISRGGKVVYSKAFGFYAPQKKANTSTEYRIGSVTKPFIAVMVLQLAQEGKLTLKTPIGKYFPQLPNAAKITVDQLLGHQSGLHDFTADPDYKTYAYTKQSKAQMLARITRLKTDFKPGERTVYSSTNYLLLGYIIEQASGKSLANNFQQRIAGKIGLQHTRFGTDNTALLANEAQSFNYNGQGWLPVPATNLSVPGGAGAMLSTPTDLVAFIRALFKLKLVNKATLTGMMPIKGNLGRGLIQVPVADQLGYGHFGIIDGFKNSLIYLPESDLAIALCLNSANTNDNAVVEQVLNITLRQLSNNIILPAAQLAKYTGTYASRQIRLPITLRTAGGYLLMQAGNNQILTLETLSPTRFRFAKGDMLLNFNPANFTQFTLNQGANVYEYYKN